MRRTLRHTRIASLGAALISLLLLSLAISPCSWAQPGLDVPCAPRQIANHLIDGELQQALELSIECEDKNRANIKGITGSYAEQRLKSSYLVSAQILTAQGKLDLARARIAKASAIPGNVLILREGLEDTVDGYLMERSGRIAEAEQFYRRISRPYAQVRLGAIYLDQGRIDDALRAITASVKDNPSDPAAQAILGDILERSDKSSAMTAYKLALTLAQQGAPSVVPLTYIEVSRAKRGVARLP